MSESNPTDRFHLALDLDFLRRVYRTSIVLVLLLGVFIWEGAGRPAALAWFLGGGMSLAGLAATEWSIRRFIRPEARSTGALLWASLAKLLLIIGVVVGAFWAATRGLIQLPWALPGFMLPHLVILLKLAGRKVQQMAGVRRGGHSN